MWPVSVGRQALPGIFAGTLMLGCLLVPSPTKRVFARALTDVVSMWPSEREVTIEPGEDDLAHIQFEEDLDDPATGYLVNDKMVIQARLSIPLAPNRCAPFGSICNSEVNFE